ncbi:cytochrome bd oxidase small subunit CydS [Paenibacillus alginolyticus]
MENLLIQYAPPVFVLFSLVFMILWVPRAADVTE